AAGASTYIVDRIFRTAEGARWIVDYKTSHHEGADREAFLDSERERYREQLERYAAALGARPASLGLYFPLLGAWRGWGRGWRWTAQSRWRSLPPPSSARRSCSRTSGCATCTPPAARW